MKSLLCDAFYFSYYKIKVIVLLCMCSCLSLRFTTLFIQLVSKDGLSDLAKIAILLTIVWRDRKVTTNVFSTNKQHTYVRAICQLTMDPFVFLYYLQNPIKTQSNVVYIFRTQDSIKTWFMFRLLDL